MTKYVITSEYRLYKEVRHNADFAPDHKFMNKISKDGALKVFMNPVTAIAYDYNIPRQLDNEYPMDKKDIIKALDFWINDKVLENEKLLKLNNKLEDFHETELKSLIRIKDRVSSMPNDTIFKRFNNSLSRDYHVSSSDTVEFWYEAFKSPVQQGGERSHIPTISSTNTMTNRTITGSINNSWSINDHLRHLFTNSLNFGGDHSNEIVGYFRANVNDDDEISGTLGGGRHRDHAPINNDPNTWTVHRMGDNPRRWLVREPGGRTIEHSFLSETSAQGFIEARVHGLVRDDIQDAMNLSILQRQISFLQGARRILTGSGTIPQQSQQHLRFEDMYVNTVNTTIGNNISVEVEFRGTNGAGMTVHMIPNHSNGVHTDITMEGPHTIQLLGNSRIEIDGQEYRTTEPISVSWNHHVPLATTIRGTPATFNGNDNDFIDYYNMYTSTIGNDQLEAGSGSYTTAHLEFTGSLVDIQLQVYVTGSEIDQLYGTFTGHKVRVFNNRKDIIEINDHRIHVISMDVTYK